MYIVSQSITWSFEPNRTHLPFTCPPRHAFPKPHIRVRLCVNVYIYSPSVRVNIRQVYMIFICVRVGASSGRRSL